MTKAINIKKTENAISVTSPYNRDFIEKAKDLNGKWNPADKTWDFGTNAETELMKALMKFYGYTGNDNPEMVEVEIDAWYFEEGNQIRVGGIQAAYRYGRDTRVKLSEGWIVTKGTLAASGGSRANPKVLDHKQFDGDLILKGKIPAAVYETLEGNQKKNARLV